MIMLESRGAVRRSRSAASTRPQCGATSMDFTLPVLRKRSGGAWRSVPAAIVHGFDFSSLLVPGILMAFFSLNAALGR